MSPARLRYVSGTSPVRLRYVSGAPRVPPADAVSRRQRMRLNSTVRIFIITHRNTRIA